MLYHNATFKQSDLVEWKDLPSFVKDSQDVISDEFDVNHYTISLLFFLTCHMYILLEYQFPFTRKITKNC